MTKTMHFFDTLLFSKAMKEAGMSEKTADALAEELKSFKDNSDFATKTDLSNLETALKGYIKNLEKDLKSDMKILEKNMIIKLGGLIVIAVSVLAGLIKL